MKTKYLTKIYWSDADEAYVAEVPVLEGCMSKACRAQLDEMVDRMGSLNPGARELRVVR